MDDLETASAASVWHAGEKSLQESVGAVARMEEIGPRVIRDHLIEQHRAFYRLVPFVVLGTVDAQGAPWATLRAATPGFLQALDPKTLRVEVPRDTDDPADNGMQHGDAIGLLGIDLRTRRRNRLNGHIHRQTRERFDIDVEQSFGNCPKYIQLRTPAFTRDPALRPDAAPVAMDKLNARGQQLIRQADTFFVASYADVAGGGRQVDVSHRGGKTGFVRVDDDGVLTIPDFTGNQFFNTLGNILLNGRAGLVFIDFETGDLLQMTGHAQVLLDSPEIESFHGAERLWRVTPQRIVYRAGALPLQLRFQDEGWSPYLRSTGSWDESVAHV